MKMSSQERVRKMLARGCKKNGQLPLPPVHTPYQKMPTNRPLSSPPLSKLLGEKIRNNLLFTVTCGGIEGKLHKERFNNSEPCILSQSRWFTPSQFEKFAGMEKHKKWKTSICYEHLPLQTFIQEGFLSSPSFKLRRIKDTEPQCRRALFAPSRRTRHVTERCGKCIRTEDSWLTPQQFLNLNMSGGNWRRDITSHGEPLGTLIMRRVLEPHAVNCVCSSCSGENQLDQKNDDLCFNCNSEGDDGDDLVCCDECPRAFHHRCHNPPLQDDTLGDQWICSCCTAARNQSHEPSGVL